MASRSPRSAAVGPCAAGFPHAVVQAPGADDLTVRTESLSNAEEAGIRQAVAELGGETENTGLGSRPSRSPAPAGG